LRKIAMEGEPKHAAYHVSPSLGGFIILGHMSTHCLVIKIGMVAYPRYIIPTDRGEKGVSHE
jgi:hypothetical protein